MHLSLFVCFYLSFEKIYIDPKGFITLTLHIGSFVLSCISCGYIETPESLSRLGYFL